MATQYLALNNRTGTPRVKIVANGVPSDQGVALPSATTETDSWTYLPCPQRVIRFLGHSTWIAVQKQRIYRTTDSGASYTVVFGPDADLGEAGKAGPFLFFISGVPTLVVMAINSSGQVRMFSSTDGVTWTKSGTLATVLGDTNRPIGSCVQWRGSLYSLRYSTLYSYPFVFILSPSSSSFSELILPHNPAGNGYAMDLCVVNDRLFLLIVSFGGSWLLYEMVGGSWTLRATIVSGATAASSSTPALFYDNDTGHLIALMFIGSTGPGSYQAYSINPTSFATADLGATITGAFGTYDQDTNFRAIYDGSESVGGTPTPYIYVKKAAGVGGPMDVYQWNGTGSAPTSIGSGIDRDFSLPYGDQATAGGNVFWTPGQRHIERVSTTPVAGGVRYGFKLYSPNPSVDAVNVRFLRGVATAEYPSGPPYASLANPSVGSISGGDTLTGLDAADNGATTFFVTWLAPTDGFSVGDYAGIVPTVYS